MSRPETPSGSDPDEGIDLIEDDNINQLIEEAILLERRRSIELLRQIAEEVEEQLLLWEEDNQQNTFNYTLNIIISIIIIIIISFTIVTVN